MAFIACVFTAYYILTTHHVLCQRQSKVLAAESDFEILSLKQYTDLSYKKYLNMKKDVFKCDFDNDLCNFHTGRGHFHWTYSNRKTPSGGTGPYHDMSGKGLFAYIEASKPRKKGDKAFLVTPVLPAMVYCLQFGFHAHGTDIGGLFINKKDIANQGAVLIEINKSYGKYWHYAVGTVVNKLPFQIEFEGVCGDGYRGDIAIDNIRIMKGKCPDMKQKNSCGVGYSDIITNRSNYPPPYLNWPWLVGLVPYGAMNVLCTGAYVHHNFLLTTMKCFEKFDGKQIAIFSDGGTNTTRRVIGNHVSNVTETVLLELSNSSMEQYNICLPPNLPRLSRKNCYLIATAFSAQNHSFKENIVRVVQPCPSSLINKNKIDEKVCVEVDNSENETKQFDGFLVCRNEIIQSWIFRGIGYFRYSHHTTRKLIMLTKISRLVNWVNDVINITNIASPDNMVVPKPPPALPGFQIFEKTREKCLTYNAETTWFIYDVCEDFRISQRFQMTSLRQLVSLATNKCLIVMNTGRPAFLLRIVRCQGDRRSQQWSCIGNMISNDFYKTQFMTYDYNDGSKIRLTNVEKYKGHFIVFNTKDPVCSVVKTVNGEMNCDENNEVMCGFKDEGSTKYEWVFRRPTADDMIEIPQLHVSDRFFKVVWRDSHRSKRSAILRSPLFNDQRCFYFQSYLYGSPRDQLIVYKNVKNGRKVLLKKFSRASNLRRYWSHHYITVNTRHCQPYQIYIEAVKMGGGPAKFALRGMHVYLGSCESQSAVDFMSSPPRSLYNISEVEQCLKGWSYLNGSCYYHYQVNTTWYQASELCSITGGELSTDLSVTSILPVNTSTWFGVRSCLNGDLLTIKSQQYSHHGLFHEKGQCIYIKTNHIKQYTLKSTSCGDTLHFICRKDPQKSENGCGLTKKTVSIDRKWPWHVLIVIDKRCQCAGTLVEPGYVLTSSICVFKADLTKLKIFIPSSRTIIHDVTKILIHPDPYQHVAILIFNHSILSSPNIRFACLNKMTDVWIEKRSSKNEMLRGGTCHVLGWGTYSGGTATCGPRNYRVHNVVIVDKHICGQYFGQNMLKDGDICAKRKTWAWNTCLGDTGGPLICDVAGAWTLVGVTKWGAGCAPSREIGIYTDVASIVSWLAQYSSNQL